MATLVETKVSQAILTLPIGGVGCHGKPPFQHRQMPSGKIAATLGVVAVTLGVVAATLGVIPSGIVPLGHHACSSVVDTTKIRRKGMREKADLPVESELESLESELERKLESLESDLVRSVTKTHTYIDKKRPHPYGRGFLS